MARKERKQKEEKKEDFFEGIWLFKNHSLFGRIYGINIWFRDNRNAPACTVNGKGEIIINRKVKQELSAGEWFYLIAHQYLHSAFGHFDQDKLPERTLAIGEEKDWLDEKCWKLACDLYNRKFLKDMRIGNCPFPEESFDIGSMDERGIYKYLLENGWTEALQEEAATMSRLVTMEGLSHPNVYAKKNPDREAFAKALAEVVRDVLRNAGEEAGNSSCSERVRLAKEWFISHYPLLGGLAAGFQIQEDYGICCREEIQIAAVDIEEGMIFLNPAARLEMEELKFVLAHEFLHAALLHHERCQGRDAYLWNVACDYIINGWLVELGVGCMPEGALYDPALKDLSAESIYDRLVGDLRRARKLLTLRGYGKGDVITGGYHGGREGKLGRNLEDFYKEAIRQGLEFHESSRRGCLPAGLVEEIRAIGMPPIPWDVQLAQWFEDYFPLPEKYRSYARPSRRQGSSPDIPRPRLTDLDREERSRTFGVVIDTSASMSVKMLAMALGSIASFATSREVPLVRVIFCDAAAYDAGYIRPEELTEQIEVKGRGGTRLQPGVDCLLQAKNFPKDGPLLIITDGEVESDLRVKREHAFLIPKGKRLPFRSWGKVFYL